MTDVGGKYWGISIALGIVSIPLGYLLRCIPNEPVERFLRKIRLMRDPSVLPIERPNAGVDSTRARPTGRLTGKIAKLMRRRRSSVALSRTETRVGTAEIKSGLDEETTAANELQVTPVQATLECGPDGEKDIAEGKM